MAGNKEVQGVCMESNNKLILSNSVILYIRLIIISLVGLIVMRVILKALGVEDFGIYAVVGGIVALVGFVNTVMLTATNRFIACELGRGDLTNINKIFNVSLLIHLAIAFIVLILAKVIGEWYINHYLKIPEGKLSITLWVFRYSVLGSVISFIGVPYNGLIIAKEKFLVFCSVDILVSLLKLVASYLILYYFINKLLVYAVLIGILTAFPTIVYFYYCKKKFPRITRFRLFWHWEDYKEIFNFSVWVGYGALASVGKLQGAALIVNYFWGAALNTALGIANSVNAVVVMFAGNVGRAISPQINKSYAAGNKLRTEDLVIAASKYTYFLLLLPAVPLLIQTEYILKMWLTLVPEYTVVFVRLIIIDALIGALNAGIPDAIFASGKIRSYQLIVNTIFLFSLPVAYWVLKSGYEPYALQYTYIVFSVIVLIVRQIILQRVVKFNTRRIILHSYFPALLVSGVLCPWIYLRNVLPPFWTIGLSVVYALLAIFFCGLKKEERLFVLGVLNRFVLKFK